jgi:hypothetical protein
MLFEIPSGFAMFEVSQELIARPKDIWARFAYQDDITNVHFTFFNANVFISVLDLLVFRPYFDVFLAILFAGYCYPGFYSDP